MWEKRATDTFINTLTHLKYGSMLVTTPDGKRHEMTGTHPGAHSTLHITDWRTIPAFAVKGDIGLAEAYRDGWWHTDNLTDLMVVGLENTDALDPYLYGSAFSRMATRLLYLFTCNTIKGSKRNIHAHYDLGNDFYSLWLDPSMTYSSALFHNQNESLERGQYNKYHCILDQLDSSSGRLLEIGCGWGGFAEQALQRGDYDVKGITLSSEQHHYAQNRLKGNANIALEDYRHQHGQYDQIVSIEMFEAVGEKFWPVYFSKIKSLLAAKGKAVVQTITIDEKYFDMYRKGGDMVRTFIFPGGMLPSLTRFKEEAAKADLKVTNTIHFGQDYNKTLQAWLASFDSKADQVRALGFDEGFIRTWRFYLAACAASFQVNRTDVLQVQLQHA